MKTVNSKIIHLPSDQLECLLSVKNLYKSTFYYNTISRKELIGAIENKAIERGYLDIGLLLNTNDLEEYFKR